MNESDALTKWCPMVRFNYCGVGVDGTPATDHNRGARENVYSCIASGCMMWEPYDYWVNEKDQAFAEDADHEKRRNIVGGDCGLKRQPAE